MTRATKIIATLGPATDSSEMLAKLITQGVNVFRLNMSHAQHDWCADVTLRIREQAKKLNMHVAVLVDLQGPSIRTGDLEEEWSLAEFEQVELRKQGVGATLERSTVTNYDGLFQDLTEGDTVIVDNGMLMFRVLKVEDDRAHCEVLTPGTMTSRRHINLPGVKLRLPGLTEKDHRDIKMAAEIDADWVAMSFVRGPEHLVELRERLDEQGLKALICAKIEDQQAVENLDGIIGQADAVMVARGDLGMEVPYEELPVIQRRTVRTCIEQGTPVIVATHMLESMIQNPSPTRAEITDVANAVYEQADAIMLSGETSVGEYPLGCVEVFDRIGRRIEKINMKEYARNIELTTEKQKTVKSAVVLANNLEDSVIVVFTKRGLMARYAGNMRPTSAPIFAFTEDVKVCRMLSLVRGIRAFETNFEEKSEQTILNAVNQLKEQGLVKDGQSLVIVSDLLQGEFIYDSVLLRRA